ncbi:MAG: PAS domain S-box protein, partial [bacterium]
MDKVKQVLTPKFPDADDVFVVPNTFLDDTTKVELKTTFEEVVYNGLKKVLLGLTIIFFVLTLIHLFFLPKSIISIVVPVSSAITVICGSLSYVLRKIPVSIKVANAIGGSISILATIDTLLVFYFLAQPRQIIGITLIIVASGSLLMSLEWLVISVSISIVGWAMVMWLTNQPDWLRNGFLIFCSSGLSYLVFVTRMYALGRLKTLNLKYQARKIQLESVLEDKEKANLQLEEALKKLKESREDLKILINSVNGIVWESDINLSQFLFVSRKVEKILGYSTNRWLEEKGFWMSHIHPEDQETVLMYSTSEIKYGRDYELEYRMIAADGATVWLKDIVTVVFENERVSKLQGVMFDITDSKKIEAALIRSENRYRDLFEKANDIIYTHDLSGKFVSVNTHAKEVLGYSYEEILTMNIGQILQLEQLERVKERIKKRLAGENFPSQELTLRAKDGHEIIFEVSSWLEWENGVPVAIHGIARDITERKRIEEALKESEERYRSLFSSASIGI